MQGERRLEKNGVTELTKNDVTELTKVTALTLYMCLIFSFKQNIKLIK